MAASPCQEVAEMCFTGIASQLGGLGFEQIALRSLTVHDRGFSPDGNYTVTCPAHFRAFFCSLAPFCVAGCVQQIHFRGDSGEELVLQLAQRRQIPLPSRSLFLGGPFVLASCLPLCLYCASATRPGADAEKHLNDPMVIAKLQEVQHIASCCMCPCLRDTKMAARLPEQTLAQLMRPLRLFTTIWSRTWFLDRHRCLLGFVLGKSRAALVQVKASSIRGQLDFKPPR